jgi:hypothetical protein
LSYISLDPSCAHRLRPWSIPTRALAFLRLPTLTYAYRAASHASQTAYRPVLYTRFALAVRCVRFRLFTASDSLVASDPADALAAALWVSFKTNLHSAANATDLCLDFDVAVLIAASLLHRTAKDVARR